MAANRPRPPPMAESSKLDGTNYSLWKLKMRSALDSYELLNMVLGKDVKPIATIDSQGNSIP
eukprot:c28230_g1_i2 orf=592-777(+)